MSFRTTCKCTELIIVPQKRKNLFFYPFLYGYVNYITGLFSDLFTNLFENTKKKTRCSHFYQTSPIVNAVKRGINGNATFSKNGFYIKRNFNVCSVNIGYFFNFCVKLKSFTHTIYF